MNNLTIGRQLNNLFEEIYILFDEAIITQNQYIKPNILATCNNEIVRFMETITIRSEWNLTDEERNGHRDLYFEHGRNDCNTVHYPFNSEYAHNGCDAVYYPFNNNETNIDNILFKANDLFYIWDDILECIIDYSDNQEHVNHANQLKPKLDIHDYIKQQ
jgi:hypothetical protein